MCRKVENSKFLQIYHDFSALYSDVVFKILSFDECEFFLNDITAELHIIIAELSPNDDPDSWFPHISALSALFPHLKIIFILTGNPEHHFYYLNQLPFTYLIPESQVSALFPIGLDKAITELNYYRSVRPFTRISAEPSLLSAAYFSTDNLTRKGKKECHMHYPDGRCEYIRESLKKICLPVGPKYRNAIMEYILNKYTCVFSPDPRAKEGSYE